MSGSCDPMEYGLLGSSVRGISQAVILEWVTISFSRRSFQVRDWTCISCFGKQILVPQATRETSPVLYLKWISYRQHIVDSWLFIPFANFCLVITVFELLIFKVIVLFVFVSCLCVFFLFVWLCHPHGLWDLSSPSRDRTLPLEPVHPAV